MQEQARRVDAQIEKKAESIMKKKEEDKERFRKIREDREERENAVDDEFKTNVEFKTKTEFKPKEEFKLRANERKAEESTAGWEERWGLETGDGWAQARSSDDCR